MAKYVYKLVHQINISEKYCGPAPNLKTPTYDIYFSQFAGIVVKIHFMINVLFIVFVPKE